MSPLKLCEWLYDENIIWFITIMEFDIDESIIVSI